MDYKKKYFKYKSKYLQLKNQIGSSQSDQISELDYIIKFFDPKIKNSINENNSSDPNYVGPRFKNANTGKYELIFPIDKKVTKQAPVHYYTSDKARIGYNYYSQSDTATGLDIWGGHKKLINNVTGLEIVLGNLWNNINNNLKNNNLKTGDKLQLYIILVKETIQFNGYDWISAIYSKYKKKDSMDPMRIWSDNFIEMINENKITISGIKEYIDDNKMELDDNGNSKPLI